MAWAHLLSLGFCRSKSKLAAVVHVHCLICKVHRIVSCTPMLIHCKSLQFQAWAFNLSYPTLKNKFEDPPSALRRLLIRKGKKNTDSKCSHVKGRRVIKTHIHSCATKENPYQTPYTLAQQRKVFIRHSTFLHTNRKENLYSPHIKSKKGLLKNTATSTQQKKKCLIWNPKL